MFTIVAVVVAAAAAAARSKTLDLRFSLLGFFCLRKYF